MDVYNLGQRGEKLMYSGTFISYHTIIEQVFWMMNSEFPIVKHPDFLVKRVKSLWVLEDGGNVNGATIVSSSGDAAVLDFIAVRQKRQGHGSELLNRVIENLPASISTMQTQTRAPLFFRANGFQYNGEVYCDSGIDYFSMSRSLD